MKKRGNDTHQLAANDGQGTLPTHLLTDAHLAMVHGGASSTDLLQERPRPTVQGKAGDDYLELLYPGIGAVEWRKNYQHQGTIWYLCLSCTWLEQCDENELVIDPLDKHSWNAHLGDEGDGNGRY
ncbi:MAG: hypothetical protein LBJ95_04150 [Oscillospiraceae bacterium]|jgi:hypothetical protein|nr:hypothetical protein [Oscillospiraceae bacterium]